LEHFLKFLNEKPKFKKEIPFALKHIETGHNNKYAYGSEVRDV